eukprot:TRINITY_DN2420_c0_g1_i2.p1 TRINITY_DN2420_c0_g1~~TRINITY_DN2420_c0_g1_i2.p1  ORF type:complete len:674 (-),score=160.82 TRINITY_DN2420_c0_g1_i2:13-2034(-)
MHVALRKPRAHLFDGSAFRALAVFLPRRSVSHFEYNEKRKSQIILDIRLHTIGAEVWKHHPFEIMYPSRFYRSKQPLSIFQTFRDAQGFTDFREFRKFLRNGYASYKDVDPYEHPDIEFPTNPVADKKLEMEYLDDVDELEVTIDQKEVKRITQGTPLERAVFMRYGVDISNVELEKTKNFEFFYGVELPKTGLKREELPDPKEPGITVEEKRKRKKLKRRFEEEMVIEDYFYKLKRLTHIQQDFLTRENAKKSLLVLEDLEDEPQPPDPTSRKVNLNLTFLLEREIREKNQPKSKDAGRFGVVQRELDELDDYKFYVPQHYHQFYDEFGRNFYESQENIMAHIIFDRRIKKLFSRSLGDLIQTELTDLVDRQKKSYLPGVTIDPEQDIEEWQPFEQVTSRYSTEKEKERRERRFLKLMGEKENRDQRRYMGTQEYEFGEEKPWRQTEIPKSAIERKISSLLRDHELSNIYPGDGYNENMTRFNDWGVDLFDDTPQKLQLTKEDYIYYKLIDVRRHTNITKGGRIYSYSAFVVIASGTGTASWGHGKGQEVTSAVSRALDEAIKNPISIDRWDNRTLSDSVSTKFMRCFVQLRKFPENGGMSGNIELKEFMEQLGFSDLGIKVIGRKRPRPMWRAIFKALQMPVHPDLRAKIMGRILFDANKVWRKQPCVYSY